MYVYMYVAREFNFHSKISFVHLGICHRFESTSIHTMIEHKVLNRCKPVVHFSYIQLACTFYCFTIVLLLHSKKTVYLSCYLDCLGRAVVVFIDPSVLIDVT